MTPTKEQQAQEYAESFPPIPNDDITYAIGCAWLDGYTACEQYLWRSVEEELPEDDNNVLVYVPSTEFRIGGYEVAYYDGEDWYTTEGEHIRPTHFMSIPSLPDTNTEKK